MKGGYASGGKRKLSDIAIIDDAAISEISSHIAIGTNGKDGKDGKDGRNGSDASVTKSNVEAVLIGVITTHSHVQNLINVILTIGTINI